MIVAEVPEPVTALLSHKIEFPSSDMTVQADSLMASLERASGAFSGGIGVTAGREMIPGAGVVLSGSLQPVKIIRNTIIIAIKE